MVASPAHTDHPPSGTPDSPISPDARHVIAKAVSIPHKIPPNSCFEGMVTIDVGPDKTVFNVHKAMIIHYSDFFRGAFTSSFIEGVEGKLSLPDEQVDIFAAFNKFMYTRRLCDEESDRQLAWDTLFKLWVFGDKHLAPSLQNKVMNILVKKNFDECAVPTSQLHYIYENTLPGSPLRMIVMDWIVCHKNPCKFLSPASLPKWPHEALADLVKLVLGQMAKPVRMPSRSKCHYHVHATGEQC